MAVGFLGPVRGSGPRFSYSRTAGGRLESILAPDERGEIMNASALSVGGKTCRRTGPVRSLGHQRVPVRGLLDGREPAVTHHADPAVLAAPVRLEEAKPAARPCNEPSCMPPAAVLYDPVADARQMRLIVEGKWTYGTGR